MKNGYDQHFDRLKKQKTKARNPALKFQSRAKRKPVFPFQAMVVLAGTVLVAGWGLLQPDSFENLFSKIEVNFLTLASAADDKPAEKSAGKKVESAATSAKSGGAARSEKDGEDEGKKSEDTSYLSKLNDRKKELDLREKELGELEEELHRQRTEVEAQIKKLEDIRAQIASVLKDRVEADQSKVDKLVEFYSNMKPKQAADILSSLNEDLAVEILGKMKKKNAAEIMNLLPAAKAQLISEKFAGYKRR